jgi:hypothetical protein
METKRGASRTRFGNQPRERTREEMTSSRSEGGGKGEENQEREETRTGEYKQDDRFPGKTNRKREKREQA